MQSTTNLTKTAVIQRRMNKTARMIKRGHPQTDLLKKKYAAMFNMLLILSAELN